MVYVTEGQYFSVCTLDTSIDPCMGEMNTTNLVTCIDTINQSNLEWLASFCFSSLFYCYCVKKRHRMALTVLQMVWLSKSFTSSLLILQPLPELENIFIMRSKPGDNIFHFEHCRLHLLVYKRDIWSYHNISLLFHC